VGSHKGTTTLLRKSSTIYERIVNSSFKIRFLDYIALSLEGVTVLEKPRVSRETIITRPVLENGDNESISLCCYKEKSIHCVHFEIPENSSTTKCLLMKHTSAEISMQQLI
jgi:hypothetical protein